MSTRLKLRRVLSATMLLATLCLAATSIVPVGTASASKMTLTITQQSQVRFLMAYSHNKNGSKPSFSEAAKVVREYHSVLTMVQAEHLGLANFSAPTLAATASTRIASTTEDSTVLANSFPKFYASGSFWWYQGTSATKFFGWHQYLSWRYNPSHNWVGYFRTHGYPWVSKWAEVFWKYDGEYTSDYYPYWSTGTTRKGVRFKCYHLIQIFAFGYGPLGGQYYMRMWILGGAHGGLNGGYF